jgi:hypothetical protein
VDSTDHVGEIADVAVVFEGERGTYRQEVPRRIMRADRANDQ